jgi:preprotein translocase subunit YajC
MEGETVVFSATQSGGSNSFGLIMIVLLIGAMYFLMIRPQSKKRREASQMQSTLRPGDEIVTIGGLYGTVTAVDDDTVSLEVAPDVILRFARGAVGRVITKPTEPVETTNDSDAENTIDQA